MEDEKVVETFAEVEEEVENVGTDAEEIIKPKQKSRKTPKESRTEKPKVEETI